MNYKDLMDKNDIEVQAQFKDAVSCLKFSPQSE